MRQLPLLDLTEKTKARWRIIGPAWPRCFVAGFDKGGGFAGTLSTMQPARVTPHQIPPSARVSGCYTESYFFHGVYSAERLACAEGSETSTVQHNAADAALERTI